MDKHFVALKILAFAENILAKPLYIYDPLHKKHPAGGYERTKRGWTLNTREKKTEIDKLNERSQLGLERKFDLTLPVRFHDGIKRAKSSNGERERWRVDVHDAVDYKNCKCAVTKGGSTVAVTSDGDIISVCKRQGSHDKGSELLKQAVKIGGRKLDAFGEKLFRFYTKNGFEPVSVTDFNEEYAPPGWKKGVDEKEAIVFYKYIGKPYTAKTFKEFVSSVPHYDYDTAGQIRDKEL